MKRVLSLFLSCIFVLGVCFSTPIVASAAEGEETQTVDYSNLPGNEFTTDGYIKISDIVYFRDGEDSSEVSVKAYVGSKEKLTISSESISILDKNYSVTKIEAEAFTNCEGLTQVTINSGIEVDTSAFENCVDTLKYIMNLSGNDISVPDGIIVHESACRDAGVTVESDNTDNVITATCNNEDCKKERGTLTLVSDDVIVYDGESHAVDVVVSGTVADDYSEETGALYTDNANPNKEGTSEAPKDVGSYTATFTIAENVSATKQFTIEPKTIAEENVDLTVSEGTYTGLAQVIGITVKDGETPLTEADYTITYKRQNGDVREETSDLTSVGTIFVEVAGKGNYTGTVTNEYIIGKATLSASDFIFTEPDKLTYDSTQKHAQVIPETGIIGMGEVTLNYYKVIENDEPQLLESAPTEVGDYIVKIDVADGTNYNSATEITSDNWKFTINEHEHDWKYSASGATITATCQNGGCDFGTAAVEITLTAPTDGLVYDGSEKTANVIVPEENTGIQIPEIVYSGDRRNVTEDGYTATITLGDGENVATATINLKITSKPLTEKDIEITGLESSYVYTGSAIEPSVVVKDGDDTLVEGTDYDVAYSANTDVGTATVTIKFKGNYSGTVEKTFEIVAHKHLWSYVANAASSTITATCTGEGNCGVKNQTATITLKLKENSDWVYNNTEKKFAFVEGSIDGVTLPEIVYSGDCINVGDYTASITLGEAKVSVKFTINKATPVVSDFSVTTPENLTYDGETKKVNVSCGADIGDITVEYYSEGVLLKTYPIEPGTYTVKLQVKGNNNYNSVTLENDVWNFTIIECKHEWVNGVCKICNTECEHEFDSPEITKNPTCNAPGELTWVCTICKHSKITTVNPNGDGKTHDWSGDYVVTKAATCVSEGVETKTCKNGCGETTTRPIEKDTDAHVMGEWITTEQTCVADGKKVRTCTLGCGATETEVIKADNKSHKLPDEWTVTKEANCVEDGEKIKACLNEGCNYVAKESIPADGKSHNLGEWEVTIPAKCTVKGEVTQYCQNGDCTHKVTASLKPDGKTHSFAQDFTIIEATCITAGSKFKACENEGCKEVAEKTEIAINPDAHKNVETINVKQPTCEEKGYTGDEFCNDCKKTFEPGIEVDALGHTESDWIVDKEATFTEDGARHTVCKVCSKELKKEVIAKLTLATPVAKAYNKTSSIKVKWTNVDNALTYNVYRSDFINNDWTKWKKIGTVKQGVGEFSDKNVVAGKQYKYTVKAYNGEFKSSIKTSNKLTFIAPVKPALTITTTGIILKWDTVLGADKYVVYRSQLVDGKWSDWKKLSTVKDGKTSTTDTTAESGVTYKYSVRAYIGSSYTERKSSKTIVFLAQPTLKISNTEAGIKGSWKTINGATGYVITRSEYSDSDKKFIVTVKLGTASATAKSFTDKTAKEGIKYKYTITAISDSYSSLASSGKVLRRLAQPTVTIENANGAIKGKWTQVTGATKYTVYRSELVDGKWTSWKSLGTAGATAKSFTDKTVKSGVNYKYTVKAINGGSKSSVGASNNVVYLSRPEPKAVNSIYGVKVNWNAITGAESYIVYRKEYVNKQWTAWQQIGTSEVNSYIDSTAVSGVKYKYTIHAVKGESLSARKASSSLLYVATPSATVSYTGKAFEISWGQIGGATKYVVYRQVLGADGKWSASTKIASLKGVLEFTDTSAEAGNTYRYKVVAYNGKVKSSSNVTDGVLLPKAQ